MRPRLNIKAAHQEWRGNNYIRGQDQETAVIHKTTVVSLNPSPHQRRSEAAQLVSHKLLSNRGRKILALDESLAMLDGLIHLRMHRSVSVSLHHVRVIGM